MPRWEPITDAKRAKVAALCARGLSARVIADRVSLCMGTCYQIIRDAGLKTKNSSGRDPQRLKEIESRVAAGKNLSEIAGEFGVSRCTIHSRLLKAGSYQPQHYEPHFDWTTERVAELRRRYPVEGSHAIAASWGCKPGVVQQKTKQLRLSCTVMPKIIGAKFAARNTSARLDFFDHWTPDMAYVLGYIWADGCVYTELGNPAGLSFRCVETDVKLLRDAAKSMGYTRELVRYKPCSSFNTANGKWVQGKPAIGFRIHSTILAKRLAETHGVVPRKSYVDPPYPASIPDEMLSHFARGYFDGDGCISISRPERNIRACVTWVGSPRFVKGLTEAAARAIGIRVPAITLKGRIVSAAWTAHRDVMMFREWLYRDATTWLARKRSKFDAAATRIAAAPKQKAYGLV